MPEDNLIPMLTLGIIAMLAFVTFLIFKIRKMIGFSVSHLNNQVDIVQCTKGKFEIKLVDKSKILKIDMTLSEEEITKEKQKKQNKSSTPTNVISNNMDVSAKEAKEVSNQKKTTEKSGLLSGDIKKSYMAITSSPKVVEQEYIGNNNESYQQYTNEDVADDNSSLTNLFQPSESGSISSRDSIASSESTSSKSLVSIGYNIPSQTSVAKSDPYQVRAILAESEYVESDSGVETSSLYSNDERLLCSEDHGESKNFKNTKLRLLDEVVPKEDNILDTVTKLFNKIQSLIVPKNSVVNINRGNEENSKLLKSIAKPGNIFSNFNPFSRKQHFQEYPITFDDI